MVRGTKTKTQEVHSALEPRPYPWLLESNDSTSTIKAQTISIMPENNEIYTNRIDGLCGKTARGSYFEWCLFSDTLLTNDMLLWNSFNSETIRLPPLEFEGDISWFVMSSNPGNPNCDRTIYLISDSESHCIMTCQLKLKEKEKEEMRWVVLDFKEKLRIALQEYEELLHPFLFHNPVFCNGNLYAITSDMRMLLIDSLSIKALPIVIPSSDYPSPYSMHPYLVEYEGKILAICLYYGGINFQEVMAVDVYSFDCSRMMFDKVENLSELVLFLGNNCSVCCPAVDPKKEGGRIYFPLRDNKLSYYNVEEKSHGRLLRFRKEEYDYWIMPQEFSLSLSLSESKMSMDGGEMMMKNKKKKKREEFDDYCIMPQELSLGESTTAQMQMSLDGGEMTMKNKKRKEEASKETLLKFHSDIIHEFAERLRLADYCSFRSISREFRSIMSPVFNLKSALNRRQNKNPLHPWFVFFENNNIYSLFDPMHGEKYQLRLPDLLSGCKICFSIDGTLLVTSASTGLTAFFNPMTSEVFPLPQRDISNSIFGASASPMSSNCSNYLVVDIAVEDDGTMKYVQMDDAEWKDIIIEDIGLVDFKFYENSAVFYNGAFYCLGQDGNLGILTLAKETWPTWPTSTWRVLPEPKKPPCLSYNQVFLLEYDRELLSVFVDSYKQVVCVFKLNQSTMSKTLTWMEVKDIGNHMICISRSSSFSSVPKVPWMENKIFFPRLYHQNAVFYSLDT